MKTRVWRTLLCCFAAALSLTLCAWAADIVDSGTCGDNLTWTLDSDGVLTISGTGAMDDWALSRLSPWYAKRIISAVINNGVTSIGDVAFSWCENLTGVTIPNSVSSIGDYAFYYCRNLMSVTIPDSVTVIGNTAFAGCASLMSVRIPDSVTSIGDAAFAYCESLMSVIIPDGVTYIAARTFDNCRKLTSITIPDSVTCISASAFYYCKSLMSVIIPDSVTCIGSQAFELCESLTSVTIPDSVTFIGWGAFNSCKSLTDVYYGGSATQWSEIRIDSSNYELTGATIHYGAKDVGVGITLTDENGKTVDANGQTGETPETRQNAFQDGAEFSATFNAVEPEASSEFVTASVFIIFYDKDGLMVSLQQSEIDLSDPFNLMFMLDIRVPEGAKALKFLMLGDGFEPLRAARMIESSADAA